MTEHDRIAVFDFGGQYAHLIATKVRRQRVLAEIRQPEDPVAAFDGMKGIILSGSVAVAAAARPSTHPRRGKGHRSRRTARCVPFQQL